ncbi:MAG: Spy/CpxP family protein refolding chaperone [Acidobacteria bacterium]|nr:Spy/CpxP family protein refolding chaperone [Acidobacteriota bacterium]
MRSLAILLATLPMLAQAPPPVAPDAHPRANALGLSPEQQTQIQAIRQKHLSALKADHEAAQSQRQAFRVAMEDPNTSEAQLRQAFDQVNARKFQMLVERRAMRQEVRAVLTPDQRAKADAMKAQFRERHHARMERRIKMLQHRLDQDQGNPTR